MNSNQVPDPNNKNEEQINENRDNDLASDGVYAYNADGSPMDTSERTYISTELPEEENEESENE